jgi:hypothetical protein
MKNPSNLQKAWSVFGFMTGLCLIPIGAAMLCGSEDQDKRINKACKAWGFLPECFTNVSRETDD